MPKSLRRSSYALDSLLAEILLWMLMLLLFLWALSVLMTYHVAARLADKPFDDRLADKVHYLMKLVETHPVNPARSLPAAAKDILLGDSQDKVTFQLIGSDRELMAGDKDIPWVTPPEGLSPGSVMFRDDEVGGEEVRVAYAFVPGKAGSAAILVQVAETGAKRQKLAGSIVSGLIVPQFVIVPVAIMLVYFALSKGITPLQRLQEELRQRRPTDLSPISTKGIPGEIRPLLFALNGVMSRLEDNLLAHRRFIANAAHQMKTPLTGLRVQTELALQETDPGQLRLHLVHAASGVERLTHLTRQLLSLARAEATTESSDSFRRLDLDELARSVTLDWADAAMAKKIDLGFESAGEPLLAMGSEFLLRELLANLLDNAIKYTPEGGLVTVRCYGGTSIVVQVEDSGVGIPAEERPRVFERFYRVLGNETDGSGLGLPIVKEIADQHRARIALNDPPSGRGMLFEIQFPRDDV